VYAVLTFTAIIPPTTNPRHTTTRSKNKPKGGLLFPFYCGVVDELTSRGVIGPDTPLAGASAGSLIAACARSGLSMAEVLDACYVLADDCRSKGTRARLGPVLESTLRALLPPDTAERVSGRAYVAVTAVLPPKGPLLEPRLVGEFEDRDDAISALLTSCHVSIDGGVVFYVLCFVFCVLCVVGILGCWFAHVTEQHTVTHTHSITTNAQKTTPTDPLVLQRPPHDAVPRCRPL
jgi:hypothetical protein